MKQRSAMVVAAGLVVALALAGLGLAMGMTGPSADAKAPKLHRKPPIVHTTTRTITVHQPGTAASSGGAMTYSAPSSSSSTGSSDDQYAGSDDSGHETEDSHETESESGASGGYAEGTDD